MLRFGFERQSSLSSRRPCRSDRRRHRVPCSFFQLQAETHSKYCDDALSRYHSYVMCFDSERRNHRHAGLVAGVRRGDHSVLPSTGRSVALGRRRHGRPADAVSSVVRRLDTPLHQLRSNAASPTSPHKLNFHGSRFPVASS